MSSIDDIERARCEQRTAEQAARQSCFAKDRERFSRMAAEAKARADRLEGGEPKRR